MTVRSNRLGDVGVVRRVLTRDSDFILEFLRKKADVERDRNKVNEKFYFFE